MAHSGTSSSGGFVQTMVLIDIATSWTECVPVRTRESGLVIAATTCARSLFPFRCWCVDFDNDSAFMNELVADSVMLFTAIRAAHDRRGAQVTPERPSRTGGR
ncbi:hypothetical protein GHK58_29325 [Sinorhizobium meliloti]|nr:hypothetical protein [Sinorhizobium meliloti]